MEKVIAIGALGGSGTRAVAQILIESGIYMGDDMNSPNDNLIFTRLFKNPTWYQSADNQQITKRLSIFNEYMSKDTLTLKNAIELIRASHTNPTIRLDKKLILSIIKKTLNTQTQRTVWGWKEPNTQIFIDHISEYFPTLKYIHVVRHGLDMAFSDNKQQLFNWGYKYGISLDGQEKEDEIAYKQLSYWVLSTKDAISKAQRLRENFLLINHSDFCIAPKKHVDQIIQFVDIKIPPQQLENLYHIPKKTSTLGRHQQYRTDIFDPWQMDYVKELGFEFS